jgi:hypothetical protein
MLPAVRFPPKVLFILLPLLFIGCTDDEPVTLSRPVAKPQYKVGDLNSSGELVFWTMGADVPFALHDEYGVMLINDGDEKQPVPHYIFACQSTKEIVDTHDFATFTARLDKVPQGTLVGWYETCTVLRSWGLAEATKSKFAASFDKRKLRTSTDGRIVCYCASEF